MTSVSGAAVAITTAASNARAATAVTAVPALESCVTYRAHPLMPATALAAAGGTATESRRRAQLPIWMGECEGALAGSPPYLMCCACYFESARPVLATSGAARRLSRGGV
ncbi:hypothetical protein JIQ42_06545 [Leishmania sp. Namibia]|uniref:hypothetical protein n=1 Tax=Leishmania sp. Namibia TaxID=2802991 RepID=UPI001B4DF7DC|nr:hypothetical protein JIQ42_06545 [Leishmania sp. Namibia]